MLKLIQKILPDAYGSLIRRHKILEVIEENCPIGRRLLAEKVALSEGLIRNEIKVLKKQGLLSTSRAGMSLTDEGLQTLKALDELFNAVFYSSEKEEKLANLLAIKGCRIVPGDLEKDSAVLSLVADKTVALMDQLLDDGENIISVMGGTTLKEVANHMTPKFRNKRDLLFVPARGGLGDAASIEANTIAQRMAEQTAGRGRGLYAPELVHENTYKELMKEPEINKTLALIKKANLLLYSVGNPIAMAKRRGLDEETIAFLKDEGAVAEAFGEFINQRGDIILKLPNIGLQSSALDQIDHLVTVAGGKNKAQAIAAYLKRAPSHSYLITDAGAADEILKTQTN